MKKTLKSIALLGALYGGSLHASFEFRSPLDFDARGYQHWFLAPADQAWWYDQMPSQKTNNDWNIHMWGVGYSRTADRAFSSCGCEDKVTRNTTTLSELFFGKAVFRGENAFAGGTFAGNQGNAQVIANQILVNAVNPYIAFARIAPVFDYNEHGANMGIDFARYVGNNDRYHVGGRFNVPFKVIEIEADSDATFEETLDNVFITRIVNANAGIDPDQVEYAMRFDFLSTLVFNQTALPVNNTTARPIVVYNDPAGTVKLAGQSLTGTSADQNNTMPAAYATKRNDGTVPAIPFRKAPNQVTGSLGADGEGANDDVLFFRTTVDYAAQLQNDRDAQATIFITPRSYGTADAPTPGDVGNLTPSSAAILTTIQTLLDTDLVPSEPASAFFLENGIDFTGYSRVVGVGDLAMEVYGGICNYDNWFADGIFGFQIPTAARQEHASQIFYKPTGNNGHAVLKLGLDGGWKPRPWFAFEIRPFFFHAFKRSEHRAAPFAGATIVNIGPELDVDVSWNYFTLQTDFNVFHPHNPDLGFVFGYELFVKGHDHVSLDCCQKTATDLLGRPDQPLDVSNYREHTNSLSNKLRGEIFYRAHYFEIFGGGSQMVSGRNIMKETEAHIGLAIYF